MDALLTAVQQLVREPGRSPWRGQEILTAIEKAKPYLGDAGAFYSEFIERVRDVLMDEEDHVLRRFGSQSLASEARVLADNPAIRDHLVHVSQVFLLGWLILNRISIFRTGTYYPYDWNVDPNVCFDYLNRAWLFASLLHDCAYSVEYARDAQLHESNVKDLFGSLYSMGRAGEASQANIRDDANTLWKLRSSWIGDTNLPSTVLERQYTRPDHAIVGALALCKEVTKPVLSHLPIHDFIGPAAVAIACHNFRFLVDPALEPSHPRNAWLRLDLAKEPLSVLLHICDELQEWDRERADEALVYRQAVKPFRYASTELTKLDILEYGNMQIEVTLTRHLHPKDLLVKQRVCREQERAIAEAARQLQTVLAPRTDAAPHVALRVTQIVSDSQCANKLKVNWREPGKLLLIDNDTIWRSRRWERPSSLESMSFDVQASDRRRGVQVKIDETNVIFSLSTTPDQDTGARVVLRGPGGSGKSTLLQVLASSTANLRSLYVENLSEERNLTDLWAELEEIRKNDPSRDVLLLIDHLERVVESETGEYWLSQIAYLPRVAWLHVLVATRDEEFQRYLSSMLEGRFAVAQITARRALLVPSNGNILAADARGRVMPEAIERGLTGSNDALIEIGLVAASWGTQRARDLANLRGQMQYQDRPVLSRSQEGGRYRFRHDSIQDLLTAAHLARKLAVTSTPHDARAVVYELRALPRDVPRMLFGFLAYDDGLLLAKDDRRKAATALINGVMVDPTIQQWLYDTGRLDQAEEALGLFIDHRVGNDPYARMVMCKLRGHLKYGQVKVGQLDLADNGTIDQATECLNRLREAACHAETLLARPDTTAQVRRDCKWIIAFVADHMFAILSWAALLKSHKAATMAAGTLAGMELSTEDQARPLEPGWFSARLRAFANCTDVTSVFLATCSLDEDFEAAEKSDPDQAISSEKNRISWLDVRRCHLSGHLGNMYQAELMYSSYPMLGLSEKAQAWFQRSIARRERILRRMETHDVQQGTAEVFVSTAQGRADVAYQYAAVFDVLLLSTRCLEQHNDLAIHLVESHRSNERAWALAIAERKASERLPSGFRAAVGSLGIGRVLEARIRRPPRAKTFHQRQLAYTDIRKSLELSMSSLIADYRRLAEASPRHSLVDDHPGTILAFYEKKLTISPSLARGMEHVLFDLIDEATAS